MKRVKRLLVGMMVAILVAAMLPMNMSLAAEIKKSEKAPQVEDEMSLVQLGEEVTIQGASETRYYKFIPENEGYITFYTTEGDSGKRIGTIGIYDKNLNLIRENSGGITGYWDSEVTGYFEKDELYYISVVGEGKFSSYKSIMTNGIMEKEVHDGEHFVIVTENAGLYSMSLTTAWNQDTYFHLYDVTEDMELVIFEKNCAIELKKEHIYKMDIYGEENRAYILRMELLKENHTAWNGGVSVSFSAGNGTEKQPYQITSAQDLALLADQVNKGNNFKDKYFVMTADISLNETGNYNDWEETPPENKWITIGAKGYPFSGKFNGNGYTISGMYIDGYGNDLGLFGEIPEEAVVENVNICDFSIKNSYASLQTCIGGIIATNQGIINNCKSFGGFTGIVNCSNICERTVYQADNTCYWGYNGGAGGLVGRMRKGIIANCYNESRITANVLRSMHGRGNYIGGISGDVHAGSIVSCWNVGDIEGNIFCYYDDSDITMGGLVGSLSGEISNSYNKGNIRSNVSFEKDIEIFSRVGGIAGTVSGWFSMGGENSKGKICNCYNSGKITNTEADTVEKLTGELAGELYSNAGIT